MDRIFYTNEARTEKSAVPVGSDLPKVYFELLEYDLKTLRDEKGLTLYDIEWTSEGITTDLDDASSSKIARDIEAKVNRCNSLVMAYQIGKADPKIDSNFYSTIIVPYGMFKSMGLKTAENCPCCQANTDWINTLWQVVWVDIKAKIRKGEEYSLDFAKLMIDAGSTANPPYTFDECYLELQEEWTAYNTVEA